MSDYTPPMERLRREYIEMREAEFGFSDLYAAEWDRALAAHDAEVRAGVVAEEPEAAWQWCYVAKWADGSGVFERVTFDAELKAFRYLADNAERVVGLNQEFDADDQIVASVEKRRTYQPGEWVPVKQEGTE